MDVTRTRLASIPTETYTSQYGEIEYSLIGKGPVVLVSHGVTGGVDQGITITGSFVSSGEDYRFLYVSRFGYLKSSAPPNDASARLQAAAYKDLLDHLGIDQVFVFGNSAGGPSAMWFAIDFPERTKGLILLSSAAPTSGPPPAIPPRLVFENDFIYWAVVKVAPDTLFSILLPKDILSTLTTEEKASLIKNVFMASLPVSERTEGINFDNYISTPSVNNIPFEQIKVPTLILQAVDDPRENEGGHELAERIADSKFVNLTGGHFLLRQEQRVQTEIAAFIAKHQ
jgi:pimeloyl-ACP methyl ester carboxylesterase